MSCKPDFRRVKRIAQDDDFIAGLFFDDVASLTQSGGVAQCQTVNTHNLSAGDRIAILNADQDIYNGEFAVTNIVDPTTFEFSISNAAPATASGQIFTGDALIGQAYEYAECNVNLDQFGRRAQEACDYLVAHIVAMSFQDSGGQGPLSTETIGGITVSRTLPYLNRTTVLGATQYGNRYLDIVNASVVPYRVVQPC